MSMVKRSFSRTAALAAVLSTVAFAAPTFAAPIDPTAPSGPPNSTINYDSNGNMSATSPDTSEQSGGMMMQQNTTTPGQPMHHYHHDHAAMADKDHDGAAMKGGHSPAEMRMHVEERIKSLHTKLMITQDQEPTWATVAQAMRDSEANVSSLIQERHENGGNMTAVDDLESYQAIAQAHADGLKKVNDSFKTLYDGMSDAQKKNADKVFGGYEGHMAGHKGMHHKKSK